MNVMVRLWGRWAARAGAARPCCPWARTTPRRPGAGHPWDRSRPASAGVRRASARWCCGWADARRGRRAALARAGLAGVKLEQWRQRAEAAFEGALKEREADPTDGQLAAAMRRIGELSMENELLRARLGRPGPLARRRSRRWRRR